MARGRRKPLIEQYRPYLNKLMGYKHGQTYNKDKRFTEGELLDITPSDVAEWMNLTAYGVVSPGPDDKPTRAIFDLEYTVLLKSRDDQSGLLRR